MLLPRQSNKFNWAIALVLAGAAASALGQSASDARMNQIQVLGSHNSYHVGIDPELFNFLRQKYGERMDGLYYSHVPIERQLDLRLRSLEIDVVYDPEGGRYAHPAGLDIEKQNHLASPAYDPQGLMNKPGLKVIHIPDIDFRSNVYTFQQELALLKAWSNSHPDHLPVAITMNAKDDGLKQPGFVQPLPFDAAAFENWDSEILKGLGREKLILPDDVRGQYATLEAAALAHAWPKLSQARGKFFFILDETGQKMETYIGGHPSLKGRAMFVNAPEGRPEAAFRIVNDAKKDWAYIQYLVRSGYYVRTRADADTKEARAGDYSRWRAALISGAQVISTDYYVPDARLGTGYVVKLPGGQPGRWNVLLLPEERPLPPMETSSQNGRP
jgi:hypothetical protein